MVSKKRRRRWPAVVLLLVVSGLAGVRMRYGGGVPYPDVTGEPLLPESALEVAVEFSGPIGNVAVAPDGRIFFTVHPESRPSGPKLWVAAAAGAAPAPWPEPSEQGRLFRTPLGVAVDRQGRLWTIDHGFHGFAGARLLAFDLATGRVVHDHRFTRDEAGWGSFVQDLQVDAAGEAVYLADASFLAKRPALLVYDVAAGGARRRLERHPSVVPQNWLIRTPQRTMRLLGGLASLSPGVDGIGLSRDGEWLWYAAMTHDTLFRVRTADLRDDSLAPQELASRVVTVGRKPLSDGLSTDLDGNALVTDVEHGGVVRFSPAGRMETLVKSSRIRWSDDLSYGPDGWLYVADSAIQEQVLRSKSHMRSRAPYFVYRFRPGADGVPGQ